MCLINNKIIGLSLSLILVFGCTEPESDMVKTEPSSTPQSNEKCEALQNEVNLKIEENLTTDEWNEFVIELQTRVPKDCTLVGDGQRF
jgi:hypothetical protein